MGVVALHHGIWWEWWSPNPTTSPPMIMRKQGPFGKWFFLDDDSFVENNQPWFVDGAIVNCASGSASFILFYFILFFKGPNLRFVKKIIIIIYFFFYDSSDSDSLSFWWAFNVDLYKVPICSGLILVRFYIYIYINS